MTQVSTINTTDLSAAITHEALAMAEEFDQIRSIYGEECLSVVKHSLYRSPDSDWHAVVDQTISHWICDNPRLNFDLLS